MMSLPLSVVCPNMHSGGTPSTKKEEYWVNGNIPWLSSSESGNYYITEANQFITQAGVDNSTTKLAPKDSVIIATAGEGKTRGQVSYMMIDAYINQSLICLEPNKDLVLPKYLFYYLRNSYDRLRQLSNITGVRGSLSSALLGEFEISFPDKTVQEKIIAILDSVDQKIALNNSICADLEAMAKQIYDYWFVQFDFLDENGRPYKSSGGAMVYNEELKREIPAIWEVGNLYVIADFFNGLACQKFRPINDVDKLPVVKITEMHDGITDKTEWVKSNIDTTHIIDDGSILFSWSASLEVMRWNGGKAGLNQHIFKVEPKVDSSAYVYLQLKDYVINFVKIAESRKTTMGHITTDHLEQSRIVIPNNVVLKCFEEKVSSLFDKATALQAETRELAELRDFLLPMLMNGQISFKDGE